MKENLLQQRCSSHQLETIAFDLDPLAEIKDKYLCLKCLMNSSPHRQSETIQDALQKFREMTTFQYNNKKNQIKFYLEQLLGFQKQMRDFQELFNNKISDSIKVLNSRIQEEQNELNSLIESQQEMQIEQDLINLSNYVNFGFNKKNNEINPKQLEFINQIQQLLDYQIFDEHRQNITNLLESTYSQSSTEEQVKLIPAEEYQVDQNKFISLRYECEIHKSKITIISLEPRQMEQRMFCQLCIQEKKLNGLTSLFEVNKQWQIYLSNVNQSNNNLYNKRQNNQSKINELIVQFQKFDKEFFNRIDKIIISQNNKIINDINESQICNLNKQLYQMELKQIKQMTQILVEQVQMQEDLQLQGQKEDKYYYDQICEQFNQFFKKLQETSIEISKFFCMNDQIMKQIKLSEMNKINLLINNFYTQWMYKMKRYQNNLSINNINIFSIKLKQPNLKPQQFNQIIQVKHQNLTWLEQQQKYSTIIVELQKYQFLIFGYIQIIFFVCLLNRYHRYVNELNVQPQEENYQNNIFMVLNYNLSIINKSYKQTLIYSYYKIIYIKFNEFNCIRNKQKNQIQEKKSLRNCSKNIKKYCKVILIKQSFKLDLQTEQ